MSVSYFRVVCYWPGRLVRLSAIRKNAPCLTTRRHSSIFSGRFFSTSSDSSVSTAVLVDADNISAQIFETFLASHPQWTSKTAILRAYGCPHRFDSTNPWSSFCHQAGVQQIPSTRDGSDAADKDLIRDAANLCCDRFSTINIKSMVIVSSDDDFLPGAEFLSSKLMGVSVSIYGLRPSASWVLQNSQFFRDIRKSSSSEEVRKNERESSVAEAVSPVVQVPARPPRTKRKKSPVSEIVGSSDLHDIFAPVPPPPAKSDMLKAKTSGSENKKSELDDGMHAFEIFIIDCFVMLKAQYKRCWATNKEIRRLFRQRVIEVCGLNWKKIAVENKRQLFGANGHSFGLLMKTCRLVIGEKRVVAGEGKARKKKCWRLCEKVDIESEIASTRPSGNEHPVDSYQVDQEGVYARLFGTNETRAEESVSRDEDSLSEWLCTL